MEANRNDSEFFEALGAKYDGHQTAPDPEVWSAISQKLAAADGLVVKRKFLFWRFGALFTFGILVFIVAFNYFGDAPAIENKKPLNSSILNHKQDKTKTGEIQQNSKAIAQPFLIKGTTNTFEKLTAASENNQSKNSSGAPIQQKTQETPYLFSQQKEKKRDAPTSVPNKPIEPTATQNQATQSGTVASLHPSTRFLLPVRKATQLESLFTLERIPLADNNTNPGAAQTPSSPNFFIGFSFTPNYSHRTLSDNTAVPSTVFNKNYYDQRENGNVNLNFGLEAGYRINQSLTLRSGFIRSQTSNTFSSSDVPIYYDTLNGTFIASSSLGDVLFGENDFEGEDGEDEDDDEQNNENNEELQSVEDGEVLLAVSSLQKFTTVQIPISLEAGINVGKFRFYVNTGVSLSFLTKSSREMSFEGVGIIRQKNADDIRKFNINGLLGLGVQYAPTVRTSIYFEPQFNYSFLSLNTESTVKYHPYTFGSVLGMRFYF